MAGKRQGRSNTREVVGAYPPGTKMRCLKNGRTYQMGVRFGGHEFWMLCESDGTKGRVDAAVVLAEFEKVKEG